MINDNNYVNVFGWMVNVLELKGNELLVYALIYGFSQDGKSSFSGSQDYIAEWLGATDRTVRNVLTSLVDKNLIIKKDISYNSFSYKANLRIIKEIDAEKISSDAEKISPLMRKKFPHDAEKFSTNNTSNNTSRNTSNNIGEKSKRFIPPSIDQVKEYSLEKGYQIDAERFVDYYESKGWMIGKNKMKDWKAAVRNWQKNESTWEKAKKGSKPKNFTQREQDFNSLERMLLTTEVH